ncbi:MAG: hypothetical protein KC591_03685 [Gemmatimonadetes bacterium]|nr:hypothetical protein [Gemmatimonadota bacterium]
MRNVLRLLTLLSTGLAVSAAGASQICIVPSTANNFNVTVDCDPLNPQIHENATIGYSTDGSPCESYMCGDALSRGGSRTYGWSISASSTSPYANSGPLLPGLSSLYLWLDCTTVDGWAAAEFRLESDNSNLLILSFVPLNGVLNAGTGTDILMAVGGCPESPFLAGSLLVLYTGPVSVGSESWGDIKAMYR